MRIENVSRNERERDIWRKIYRERERQRIWKRANDKINVIELTRERMKEMKNQKMNQVMAMSHSVTLPWLANTTARLCRISVFMCLFFSFLTHCLYSTFCYFIASHSPFSFSFSLIAKSFRSSLKTRSQSERGRETEKEWRENVKE